MLFSKNVDMYIIRHIYLAVLGPIEAHELLWLWHLGSVVMAHGLSCPVAWRILVPPPGIEPVSLALEGGFLATGSPGKSLKVYFFLFILEGYLCFRRLPCDSYSLSGL